MIVLFVNCICFNPLNAICILHIIIAEVLVRGSYIYIYILIVLISNYAAQHAYCALVLQVHMFVDCEHIYIYYICMYLCA